MKNRTPISLPPGRFAAVLLLIVSIFTSIPAKALDVLDPDGTLYTGISDSSHFNDSFTAANLFDFDMTSVAVGTFLSFDPTEYARQGPGTSYVAFQLDQIYTNIASVFFANRFGSIDTVARISVWTSTNTAFTASDPLMVPDSVAQITNNDSTGAFWHEYPLTNALIGQYFLLRLDQSTPEGTPGSNPGGREFRLGQFVAHPPTLISQPADETIYAGASAHLLVQAAGTPPLSYQWLKGTTVLSNGGNISGANATNLMISPVSSADHSGYICIITNLYGSVTSSVANLSVAPLPADPGVLAVLSNTPVAYWQLDEASGSKVAVEHIAGLNGTYGTGAGVGQPGPQPPDFPGFSPTNGAVQLFAFETNSTVALPPLNMRGTNGGETITAWIYNDTSDGDQNPYTGIVFCRGGSTVAGLICSGDGTQLDYQWGANGFDFNSGLALPENQWCFVALVYEPAKVTLYCSSNDFIFSAIDNRGWQVQKFNGTTFVGLDTDLGESERTFNGSIDEVAFYDHALNTSQIDSIFAAGKGALAITPVSMASEPVPPIAVYLADTFRLVATVSGTAPQIQWYKNSAPITGATNSVYLVTSAKLSDTGSYSLVASNQANTITSAVVNVSVSSFLNRPINPGGTLYTGISDSGSFNPSFTSANLFDFDMSGIKAGTFIPSDATEFARAGGGTSFVAFQLDQVYTNVISIFYANRFNSVDFVSSISIWSSDSMPFTATDPGTAPADVVSVTNTDTIGAIWDSYYLTNTLSGRYFLLEMDQAIQSGNPGGREFRLGIPITPDKLLSTVSSSGLTLSWSSNGVLQQADKISGPWITATGITNGIPFSTTAAQRFYRVSY